MFSVYFASPQTSSTSSFSPAPCFLNVLFLAMFVKVFSSVIFCLQLINQNYLEIENLIDRISIICQNFYNLLSISRNFLDFLLIIAFRLTNFGEVLKIVEPCFLIFIGNQIFPDVAVSEYPKIVFHSQHIIFLGIYCGSINISQFWQLASRKNRNLKWIS